MFSCSLRRDTLLHAVGWLLFVEGVSYWLLICVCGIAGVCPANRIYYLAGNIYYDVIAATGTLLYSWVLINTEIAEPVCTCDVCNENAEVISELSTTRPDLAVPLVGVSVDAK